MLLHDVFKISTNYSLLAIASILVVSMVASRVRTIILQRRMPG
jgi:hypothetical protein